MTNPTNNTRYTRREALTLLGTAAGGVVAGAAEVPLQAQQRFTSAEPPTFPTGAIIRTLQGDLPPSALADGATLFHEHVGRADIDLAVNELRECAFNGLGCIVDAATGRRTARQMRHLTATAPIRGGPENGDIVGAAGLRFISVHARLSRSRR